MKRRIRRLSLRRETIRALGPDRLRSARLAGAALSDIPAACTNTVTNPSQNLSGVCEPRSVQCDTNQCH